MRITQKERGFVYNCNGRRNYVYTYTQPIWWAIIAWLYHIYEMVTWLFWRYLERFQTLPNEDDYTDENGNLTRQLEDFMPYTNRQDLRCYYLTNKERIIVDTVYGEWTKDDRS